MIHVELTDESGETTLEDHATTQLTIGRMPGNDIVLPAGNVSKRHALITFNPTTKKFVVIDDNSANGVKVNGKKISGMQPVTPADSITIGDFTLVVSPGATDGAPRAKPTDLHGPAAREARKASASSDVEKAARIAAAGARLAARRQAAKERWDDLDGDTISDPGGIGKAREDWDEVEPADLPADVFDEMDPPASGDAGAAGSADRVPSAELVFELLTHLVEADEQRRTALWGTSCSCGECLLCESRDLLRRIGHRSG